MFTGFSGAHLYVARRARHNGPIGVSFMAVVVSAVILLGFIYRYGPVICLVLSLWRIAQRDYGRDDNLGNLVPALVLFYSMVLCQCLLFIGWLFINLLQNDVHYNLHGTFQLTKIWGRKAVWAYISDTRERCWRNPASIRGRCFVHYAVDMLDSEVQNDYLTGARVVDHFIGLDADVSSLILPSRPRIQKLIDTLGWRSNDSEIRELAARIVAYIACDIHLTQFPGAMQSISSLLDITAIYWSKKTLEVDYSVQVINGNELILQGLTILQRLACNNQQNCRDICSNPDLLHKIMAPIYSDTLMEDIFIEQWLSIVNGSFRVVLHLMQADEGTGSLMRRDISSRALSNLEKILDNGDVAGTELHTAAICIMTELALDASINLSNEAKETLVNQQLQVFFADESNDITAELKVAAGKSIAAVSNNENISAYIIREYGDIVTRLTEMLDSTNKVVCRTIAAEILENLFTHCPCIRMKDTLLVHVISEVPTRKRKPRVSGNNEEIIKIGPDEHDEEENQLPEHTDQTELSDQDRKEQLEFKAAYLSLALMLCNKMISANGIRDEDQLIVPEKGEFAANIKAILKENCRPTLFSVRIVKLSLQIAISVMQRHSHYTEHFKDEEFKSLLSEAMKIMPSLESCILFGGTDRRGNMAARPLLKDLVAEVLRLVSCPP
ncbi:unnamed protein product [Alopecurus aequalis]